mmetsp:Transcript_76125/g.223175  ORF Transcript_76125/g.223175 Transcript_76125/m.223175 type:complete len:258 (-) Transcript_76125:135-908(-)
MLDLCKMNLDVDYHASPCQVAGQTKTVADPDNTEDTSMHDLLQRGIQFSRVWILNDQARGVADPCVVVEVLERMLPKDGLLRLGARVNDLRLVIPQKEGQAFRSNPPAKDVLLPPLQVGPRPLLGVLVVVRMPRDDNSLEVLVRRSGLLEQALQVSVRLPRLLQPQPFLHGSPNAHEPASHEVLVLALHQRSVLVLLHLVVLAVHLLRLREVLGQVLSELHQGATSPLIVHVQVVAVQLRHTLIDDPQSGHEALFYC